MTHADAASSSQLRTSGRRRQHRMVHVWLSWQEALRAREFSGVADRRRCLVPRSREDVRSGNRTSWRGRTVHPSMCGAVGDVDARESAVEPSVS